MRRAGKSKPELRMAALHPVSRLAHFGIRQAHQRKCRQAIADVDLDRHFRGLQTGQRAAAQDRDGHVLVIEWDDRV
jgi:hypothetical protein